MVAAGHSEINGVVISKKWAQKVSSSWDCNPTAYTCTAPRQGNNVFSAALVFSLAMFAVPVPAEKNLTFSLLGSKCNLNNR